MPSITDLAWTDNFADNKKPFLTDLRTALDSIQTQLNDKVSDNLVQVTKDAYGSSYTFDNDGVAQYTNNLYDKKTAVDSYTGGNFSISTTGAWTDLDATNASIQITPEIAGDFKFDFLFSVQAVSSNATNEVDVRFRITDGTTSSTATPRLKLITGVTATTYTHPVHLTHVFDSMSVALQTVKLQYFISTLTNATLTVLAVSNDPIAMYAEKI